ncbi:MAG: cofactor-independent phosphoglycerate mutase [Candidatus Omnitrophica bacterium]|nr:cofactor-independent phosphoglycerate mutase [Candidatus Omnitrophota bacterium]
MKYIILVPDGMPGEPLEDLNGRTCLEAADVPNMNSIAMRGIVGTAKNVPKGMTPASDVANLSILGYNPEIYYCGRGPLEAANLGIELDDNQVAFRFNTVTIAGNRMEDYSAGHIRTEETKILVDLLNRELGSERYKFLAGCSYRNVLIVTCASKKEADALNKLECHAPHDILDKDITKYMPKNQELADLMMQSAKILGGNDVNKVRVDLNENPANMIWLWGQGKKPNMPKFEEAYGVTGAIISAVDLLKGLGRILGLDVINVPGATGYYDTNYEGKADAAIEALREKDLVYVHVEAPDEAGHNGDIRAKITAIENFDKKIVGRVLEAFKDRTDYRILVIPDHPTPISKRTHTSDVVPFTLAGNGINPDEVTVFTETSAKAGSIEIKHGHELMRRFISK